MTKVLDYTGATNRLAAALSAAGIEADPKTLYTAVLDYFEDNDFRLAHAILHDAEPADWHVIESGPDGEHLSCLDESGEFCARTLAEAIAPLVKDIDSTHIYPDEIAVRDGAIELHRQGRLMARVRRMPFTQVSEEHRHRCEGLLKGIRRYGDETRLTHRLRDLPGLQMVEGREQDNREWKVHHMMIAALQNFPSQVRKMLKDRLGEDVSQTAAANLAAAMFGVKNWQTLKAANDAWKGTLGPVLVERRNDLGNVVGREFYLDNADALWGLQSLLQGMDLSGQQVLCDGGCISHHALYVVIGEGGFPHLVEMREVTEWDCSAEDVARLTPFSGDSLEVCAAGLRELLGVSRPGAFSLMDRVALSNARNGSKTLVLKDRLFTRYELGESSTAYLQIQYLVQEDSYSARSLHAAIYKAEIKLEDGKYNLYADYGRELVTEFTGFDAADIGRLCEFSGLRQPTIHGDQIAAQVH